MENMDLRFIALLVVLAVHCECVNIGNGEIYKLELRNNVKLEYYRFVVWRYIPKAGEKLNDMYRAGQISGKACLEDCHRMANCIAVNHCDYRRNCHLDGDSTDIAQYTQAVTNSRCILLSGGLVPGENENDRAEQDDQWTHYYAKINLADYGFKNE